MSIPLRHSLNRDLSDSRTLSVVSSIYGNRPKIDCNPSHKASYFVSLNGYVRFGLGFSDFVRLRVFDCFVDERLGVPFS